MKGLCILVLKEITMFIFTTSINKTKLLKEVVGERPQITTLITHILFYFFTKLISLTLTFLNSVKQ